MFWNNQLGFSVSNIPAIISSQLISLKKKSYLKEGKIETRKQNKRKMKRKISISLQNDISWEGIENIQ